MIRLGFVLISTLLVSSLAFAAGNPPKVTERVCKSVTEVCVEKDQVVATFSYNPDYTGSWLDAKYKAENYAKKIGGYTQDARNDREWRVFGRTSECSLRCD